MVETLGVVPGRMLQWILRSEPVTSEMGLENCLSHLNAGDKGTGSEEGTGHGGA